MSESVNDSLRQAQELIEKGEHEQAQALLTPLLESESENPALWWVYAHAVSDSAIGSAALERVLQLDPEYPGARELQADAVAAQTEAAAEIEVAPLSPAEADPPDIDDWEEIKPAPEEAPKPAGSGRGLALLIVALLMAGAAVVLVLSGALDISGLIALVSPPTEEPMIVVSQPTMIATEAESMQAAAPATSPEPEATATLMQATATDVATAAAIAPTAAATAEDTAPAEPSPSPFSPPSATPAPAAIPAEAAGFITQVVEYVTEFDIDPTRSALRETQMGVTVDILVCAQPGEQFNFRLNTVMLAAVEARDQLPEESDAVAVSLLNCADANASVRTIGALRSDIDQFAAGQLDQSAFQQTWQPLS